MMPQQPTQLSWQPVRTNWKQRRAAGGLPCSQRVQDKYLLSSSSRHVAMKAKDKNNGNNSHWTRFAAPTLQYSNRCEELCLCLYKKKQSFAHFSSLPSQITGCVCVCCVRNAARGSDCDEGACGITMHVAFHLLLYYKWNPSNYVRTNKLWLRIDDFHSSFLWCHSGSEPGKGRLVCKSIFWRFSCLMRPNICWIVVHFNDDYTLSSAPCIGIRRKDGLYGIRDCTIANQMIWFRRTPIARLHTWFGAKNAWQGSATTRERKNTRAPIKWEIAQDNN